MNPLKNPLKKKDHFLNVSYDQQKNQIKIEGNKPGLEYLASVCLTIIDKVPGADHWHFSEEFYTLRKGSIDLDIIFEK